jgi:hypothetical protein
MALSVWLRKSTTSVVPLTLDFVILSGLQPAKDLLLFRPEAARLLQHCFEATF